MSQSIIATAAGGEGRLLFIEGAAGIGKTCLLEHARLSAGEHAVPVLAARATELERSFAFGVAGQLFDPVLARSGPRRAELFAGGAAAAAAALEATGGGQAGPRPGPGFEALHGLYWLTLNIAGDGPLLLLVDDAHWADEPSLRYLAFLATRVPGSRVVVVLAARPEAGDRSSGPLLAELRSLAAGVLTPLPLSQRAVTEELEERLRAPVATEFAAACHRATEGNPFFLTELVREITAVGLAPEAGGAARVESLAPRGIAERVVTRLAASASAAAAVGRALAVLGDDHDLLDVLEVAGVEHEEGEAAAEALLRAGILARSAAPGFIHPIVRSAVYAEISPHERERLHRRAASLLAERGASDEQVASHFLALRPAGDAAAAATLLTAGSRALARGAPDVARRLLKRSVEEPPADRHLVAALVRLAQAELGVGDSAAAGHLDQALELTVDPVERARTARLLATAHMFANRPLEAVQVLERERRKLDPEHRELALAMQGEAHTQALFSPAAADWLGAPAQDLRELAGDTAGERACLAALAYRDVVLGEWESAERTAHMAERALAGGRLLDEQSPDSPMFFSAVTVLLLADRDELVEELLGRAAADARSRATGAARTLVAALGATVARRRGDLTTAATLGVEAVDVARELWPLGLPLALHGLVPALLERGEAAAADEVLQRAGMTGELPDHLLFNVVLMARANLRIAQRRWEDALRDAQELGRRVPSRALHMGRWRVAAARALAELGDRARARAVAEDFERLARAWGRPTELALALRGRAAVADEGEALECLRETVTLAREARAAFLEAQALVELGTLHRRGRRATDAKKALRPGLEAAYRCDAPALIAAARAELSALGVRPAIRPGTGGASLTPTELRIARLALDGLTNRQIAEEVFVTPKTVEMHLGRIYRKLGIRSRAALAEALEPRAGATAA